MAATRPARNEPHLKDCQKRLRLCRSLFFQFLPTLVTLSSAYRLLMVRAAEAGRLNETTIVTSSLRDASRSTGAVISGGTKENLFI
jgi:hypothetical protein